MITRTSYEFMKENNNINNTISCYQRPRIFYNINIKKNNKRKTTKEKFFNLNNNNNKENININLINNNKTTSFFHVYRKHNNKNSLSKNIAFLCGIINSMNNITLKNIKDNKDIIIIQKWWKKLYKEKIRKIMLIQKKWKNYVKNKALNDYYYFSFKKVVSDSKKNNINNISNESNKNLIKSFKKEENDLVYINLRKKFIFYTTQKLSKFFLLILQKLNFFNFIKIFIQRINKSINQYAFYKIFNKDIIHINNSNTLFFYEAIKRNLYVNIDKNNINEISILLRTNIPKYFMKNYNKKYIPFINSMQEKNLIDTKLFLFNNEKLINYIIYFFEQEKKENFNDKIKNHYKKYIKNELNLHKLKNRNIFGITKYINTLKNIFDDNNNSIKSKLKFKLYKESYHSENIEDIDENIFNNNEINNNDDLDVDINNINIKKFKIKLNYMNNNE